MKIITGYTGEKHITPADDAGLHKSIFGEGDYVLHSGSQLAATIQSATEIRIADGELVMQGRHARNDSGYQAVAIANGTQGMYRNDLIVARYTKDANTSVESISLVAITGTATSGTASDPAHNIGNIENGETRDFPLYRVKLNGINIERVEQLWQLPVLPVECGGTGKNTVAGIKSLLELAKAAFVDLVTVALGGTGKTSHTANAVLTGNGTNAVNNVATANGAFYATGANGAAKFGTLPVAQGGTGSTTQAGARTNLGINSNCLIKHARDTINIDSTDGNWTTDITDTSHGTIPKVGQWVNVTQHCGSDFKSQIAISCDPVQNATGRTWKMWIRDKWSGGVWSQWNEIMTDASGVQWEKIREYSSPVASDGQTIVVEDGRYNLFLLVFLLSTDSTREISVVARRGKGNEVHTIVNLSNSKAVQAYTRKFTISDDGVIEIGSCYVKDIAAASYTSDTTKLVPVAVYGCVAG